jgi:hypothetical protein
MKNSFFRILALSLCLIASAHAQARTVVEVEIPTTLEANEAYGLIFSEGHPPQRVEAELDSVIPNIYIAKFPVTLDAGEQYASAFIVNEKGLKAFGRTVRARSDQKSIASLRTCQAESNLRPRDKQSFGLIEELVRIRYKRRDSYHEQITKILTPELLQRIHSLESKFGLDDSADIDPEKVSALALIERVSRLIHAVKRYKQNNSGNAG